ncbi:unknown protein [Microcystis aeruginosa NIES-843]|uniref:Uncharacterized protein n=1 Tax=Microcystis aeruginosa (strain NIES-843 / IAM M-2473) TaxID=449447 RepID=B0JN41_MICAN|nr:unknown protein [Microcystis aeruginosa NIES-843]
MIAVNRVHLNFCQSHTEKTGFSEKPVFYSCNFGFLSGNFLLKLIQGRVDSR